MHRREQDDPDPPPPGLSAAEVEVAETPTPELRALHHVTIPVEDVLLSSDWYGAVLGLETVVVFEQESSVEDALLAHPGGLVLRLFAAPERAAALCGFELLAIDVGDLTNLRLWEQRLDRLDVLHTPVRPAHLGWSLAFPDLSGIHIALHTREEPSAEA
ncbi:MAG: VOC family protein [Actinomycetota bacterium]